MFQHSVVENRLVQENNLTHCGLMMPYDDTDLDQTGQHWLR